MLVAGGHPFWQKRCWILAWGQWIDHHKKLHAVFPVFRAGMLLGDWRVRDRKWKWTWKTWENLLLQIARKGPTFSDDPTWKPVTCRKRESRWAPGEQQQFEIDVMRRWEWVTHILLCVVHILPPVRPPGHGFTWGMCALSCWGQPDRNHSSSGT